MSFEYDSTSINCQAFWQLVDEQSGLTLKQVNILLVWKNDHTIYCDSNDLTDKSTYFYSLSHWEKLLLSAGLGLGESVLINFNNYIELDVFRWHINVIIYSVFVIFISNQFLLNSTFSDEKKPLFYPLTNFFCCIVHYSFIDISFCIRTKSV